MATFSINELATIPALRLGFVKKTDKIHYVKKIMNVGLFNIPLCRPIVALFLLARQTSLGKRYPFLDYLSLLINYNQRKSQNS